MPSTSLRRRTAKCPRLFISLREDWNDADEYDLVFDTSRQDQNEIVSIVKSALLEKDRDNTPEARQALALRALAEKIKASVLTDRRFLISAFDVDPEGGRMPKIGFIVQGLVHRKEDVGEIEEIVKRMAGDMPVEFRVTSRTFPRFGRLKFTVMTGAIKGYGDHLPHSLDIVYFSSRLKHGEILIVFFSLRY